MDWQKIASIAELVSAYTALITVVLALVELASRSKAKKAAVAMDVYAEFLFVHQQVGSAMGAVKSFADNSDILSPKELAAFAQTHVVRPDVFMALDRVTKDGVASFDCFSETGKQKSTVIMECTGAVQNFLHYINTYLQTFAVAEQCDTVKARVEFEKIEVMHQQVCAYLESANDVLKENLKTSKDHSRRYLFVLFTVLAVAFGICAIL